MFVSLSVVLFINGNWKLDFDIEIVCCYGGKGRGLLFNCWCYTFRAELKVHQRNVGWNKWYCKSRPLGQCIVITFLLTITLYYYLIWWFAKQQHQHQGVSYYSLLYLCSCVHDHSCLVFRISWDIFRHGDIHHWSCFCDLNSENPFSIARANNKCIKGICYSPSLFLLPDIALVITFPPFPSEQHYLYHFFFVIYSLQLRLQLSTQKDLPSFRLAHQIIYSFFCVFVWPVCVCALYDAKHMTSLVTSVALECTMFELGEN